MIDNKKLFEGWKSTQVALTARIAWATSNLVAQKVIHHNRKVSAKGLHLLEAPTLLQHNKLHPNDKKIWDASYMDEYQGLVDIDTWETITEAEYQNLKGVVQGIMPTIAISVIKYDGEGRPDRAKYCIVALGNLDPNN